MRDPLQALIAVSVGRELSAIEPPDPAEFDARSLESLGIDSLARVQLHAALERASGRFIGDEQMTGARTAGDLRRLAGLADITGQAVNGGSGEKSAADNQSTRASSEETPPAGIAAPLASNQEGKATFLYLHWPWIAPVRWLRSLFLEACVRPLVWLLAAPRVEYADRAPHNTEPLLLVANHVTAYDVPLLLYALPPQLRRRVATGAAGEMLEAWRHARGNLLGPAIFWLLTVLFNVFPLPRSHGFRRAFAHAGEALDQGYSVLLFPEGRRSHGALMGVFRGGIGLLAQQAGVLVLPIALQQGRSSKGWRPYSAIVHIGTPLTIHAGEEAHAITARVENAVHALLA